MMKLWVIKNQRPSMDEMGFSISVLRFFPSDYSLVDRYLLNHVFPFLNALPSYAFKSWLWFVCICVSIFN